jgi:hypothetical protein
MLDLLPAPDHVSAMRLSGWLTADDYDRVAREVDDKLATYERSGLYVDARELRGITPAGLARDLRYGFDKLGGIAAGAFTQTRLLALKRRALRAVDRYAIVGGPRWLERCVAGARALWKIELRHFDAADESAAWAWLEAQRAIESAAAAEIDGAAS